jgi:hypothetical protein
MISGIDGPLPPIRGFVLTSKKQSGGMITTPLVSPLPAGEVNSTILAGWTYGLGRAAAFTTDAGARWTDGWVGTALYDKIFGQIIRWSMRPAGDAGDFSVATEMADGKVRVTVNALDKNDEFLNGLQMIATVVGPDYKPVPVRIEQTAPGRYVGEFETDDRGGYLVNVNAVRRTDGVAGDGPGDLEVTSIRTGVNVPYSEEFRDRTSNEALLEHLASMAPEGGKPGLLIDAPDGPRRMQALLTANTFRHEALPKVSSSQDAWFYLVFLGGCLFFFDVFFRRVQVSLTWVPPLTVRVWHFILRRQPPDPEPEYIDRLRSRKAAVSSQFDQLRAAARFEPSPQDRADLAEVVGQESSPDAATSGPAAGIAPSLAKEEGEEEEDYTSRLLKAKKKAWERRQQTERKDNQPSNDEDRL